ncbi:unnamed protein product [Cunninghamella blakesleeana]
MFGRSEKKSLQSDSTSFEEVRPFKRNEVLICTTRGKIYAVSKKDGSRYWRKDYPVGKLGGIVSIFITDTDKVILGGNGKIACLDLFTGETKWINNMKGVGYDEVSILSTPSRHLAPKTQNQIDTLNENGEAPPSYEEDALDKQMIFGCSRGKLIAIDPETGDEAWRYDCPSGGYNLPAVLVEPPSQDSEWPFQVVYVGCGRWVYCLKALTGDVLWTQKVSNATFGLDFMCLATPWSSRLLAETHTNFSSTPHAQAREIERISQHGGS